LLRELELDWLELERAARLDVVERPHFVRVKAFVQQETLLVRPDEDQIVFAARREAPDRKASGALERLGKEPIRAVAAFVRPEVVGLLDVEEVDGARGHELEQLEAVRARRFERFPLLLGELDVLIARVLEAANRVRTLDDDVVDRTEKLLLEAPAAHL